MATIAFILYPEAGHLNPTFKLARSLKRRGHRIHYFGPVDFEADIRAQGCDFIPILEQLCPRGFIREPAQAKRINNFDAILLEIEGDGREGGLGPVEEVIAKVKGVAPDLLIVNVLLPDLALILCRRRAPVVLLNIILSNPWEEGPASYKPLLNLPELVLCPADFEFPQVLKPARRHYLGASINLEREKAPFQWDRIDGDKPIFYVSLGSQSHLSPFSRRFFQSVINVMNNRSELQAIISIGSRLK